MSFELLLVQLLNGMRRHRVPKPGRGDVVMGASTRPERPFVLFPEKLRCQHLSIVGLSGTGKTYLIEHMLRQDIGNGTGFVIFDLHGDLADRTVAYLAEHATSHGDVYERAVIIEPFNTVRSFAFNPLEREDRTPTYSVARQFAHMLRTRWTDNAVGFRTEELLCNALYTLSAAGSTLLALPRFLTNQAVRSAFVTRLPADDDVRAYWVSRYDALSQKMQAAVREPILTRMSVFLTDPLIRDIVGQHTSTINFSEAMQRGDWIVLNLAKGRLGTNAAILGSMLLAKLELDIMARACIPESKRRLFVVYADELQNLASDSISTLIAEARKFRVGLVAGHQYWLQLDLPMRHALLAAGSKAFFRLHYHDALELAGELSATEKRRYVNLLTSLGTGEAVFRLGTSPPALATVLAHRPAHPSEDEVARLRWESDRRCTRLRSEIRHELSSYDHEPLSNMHRPNNQPLIDADIY